MSFNNKGKVKVAFFIHPKIPFGMFVGRRWAGVTDLTWQHKLKVGFSRVENAHAIWLTGTKQAVRAMYQILEKAEVEDFADMVATIPTSTPAGRKAKWLAKRGGQQISTANRSHQSTSNTVKNVPSEKVNANGVVRANGVVKTHCVPRRNKKETTTSNPFAVLTPFSQSTKTIKATVPASRSNTGDAKKTQESKALTPTSGVKKTQESNEPTPTPEESNDDGVGSEESNDDGKGWSVVSRKSSKKSKKSRKLSTVSVTTTMQEEIPSGLGKRTTRTISAISQRKSNNKPRRQRVPARTNGRSERRQQSVAQASYKSKSRSVVDLKPVKARSDANVSVTHKFDEKKEKAAKKRQLKAELKAERRRLEEERLARLWTGASQSPSVRRVSKARSVQPTVLEAFPTFPGSKHVVKRVPVELVRTNYHATGTQQKAPQRLRVGDVVITLKSLNGKRLNGKDGKGKRVPNDYVIPEGQTGRVSRSNNDKAEIDLGAVFGTIVLPRRQFNDVEIQLEPKLADLSFYTERQWTPPRRMTPQEPQEWSFEDLDENLAKHSKVVSQSDPAIPVNATQLQRTSSAEA